MAKIEEFAALVPDCLLDKPGRVFYSGRKAFESPSDLYVLGLNSSGDPQRENETVREHFHKVIKCDPDNWSRYEDGTNPFHKRMRYLFNRLGLVPGEVPASNLVFLRSRREENIPTSDLEGLAGTCWNFHQAVIDRLGVRVIVCLGRRSGERVRKRLMANRETDRFIEENKRGWTSLTYRNSYGVSVVQLTHPSVADWTSCPSDPTGLVVRALEWAAANPR